VADPQMNPAAQVRQAALDRAAALATGDRDRLSAFLHPDFHWTSHTGAEFDRDTYLSSNTGGNTRWVGQELDEIEVVVHESTAVLRCVVRDRVERGDGHEEFRLPMTQVWVPLDGRWVCLAGHAGPRLPDGD
jgi:ketosteroid isomerase-like protein